MKEKAHRIPKSQETILEGTPASPGIVIGKCAIYREPVWQPKKEIVEACQIEEEIRKFQNAIQQTLDSLNETYQQTQYQYGNELAEILEMQIAFLEDKLFLQEITSLITNKKYSAAYATYRVLREKREYFSQLTNEYFRDRAVDIYQLKKMLLTGILRKEDEQLHRIKGAKIIVADILTPHDTVKLHRQEILGFATNTGGKMSHTAIIARSLGVPAVVGLKSVTDVAMDNQRMVLDGNNGIVILNPTDETIKKYRQHQKEHLKTEKELLEESQLETATRDGRRIYIFANMEFEDEVPTLQNVGAEGVGLFRTEGLFLNKSNLPLEDEQTDIYTRIAEKMYPHPVIIRTLDLGGDKIAPNLMPSFEANPFLGWRAIRFWLDHKQGFLRQIKAILRANVRGNVKMMIPMVSGLGEVLEIKNLIDEAADSLRKEGKAFNASIDLGIMIEIPSVVILADILAKEVDFFSIGTNDLVQYTLAVDRGNEKVARLYSHFHPAVLRMIKMTIDAAASTKIPVNMCGEMAGDPRALPLLIAMGLRELSASPHSIPQIKHTIRELDVRVCHQLYETVSAKTTTREVVSAVNAFFKQRYPHLKLHSEETTDKSGAKSAKKQSFSESF